MDEETNHVLYQADGVKVAKCRAYAKVNLALGILGKRQDGYHEISTLMVPVKISDLVTVKAIPQGFKVFCPELPDLPQQENLAYKAAEAFVKSLGISAGFEITIEKSIPPAKGLGGGSSDAAAVLLAMKSLVKKTDRCTFGDLDLDTNLLLSIASQLGSDVPFFIGANSKPPLWEAALCTGRGEVISKVLGRRFWLVLVFPEEKVSTKEAYGKWDEMNQNSLRASSDISTRKVLKAFASDDPRALGQSLFNELEPSVYSSLPQLSIIKENLLKAGALGASMSGSGSCVYGICMSQEHGFRVKDRFFDLSQEIPLEQIVVTRTGV